jgi:hypothetical protein
MTPHQDLGAKHCTNDRRHPRQTATHRPSKQFSSASGSESEEDEEAAKIAALQAELAALKPPRPLDLFIQADTSVVVITGPNTGEGDHHQTHGWLCSFLGVWMTNTLRQLAFTARQTQPLVRLPPTHRQAARPPP